MKKRTLIYFLSFLFLSTNASLSQVSSWLGTYTGRANSIILTELSGNATSYVNRTVEVNVSILNSDVLITVTSPGINIFANCTYFKSSIPSGTNLNLVYDWVGNISGANYQTFLNLSRTGDSLSGDCTTKRLLNDGSWLTMTNITGISATKPSSTDISDETVPNSATISAFYPNPVFGGYTKVSVKSSEISNVVLEIFDITGRSLFKESHPEIGRNEREITIDTGQFTTGVYIARITIGENAETRKFSVVNN